MIQKKLNKNQKERYINFVQQFLGEKNQGSYFYEPTNAYSKCIDFAILKVNGDDKNCKHHYIYLFQVSVMA